MVFSNLGSTGFPFIFSIMTNNNLPPSNAGSGNKLINPTLTLNKAVNVTNCQIPLFAASPTILNIPTGPESDASPRCPVTK